MAITENIGERYKQEARATQAVLKALEELDQTAVANVLANAVRMYGGTVTYPPKPTEQQ